MQTNKRQPERYSAKPVHHVVYMPLFALYSPNGKEVVALVDAEGLLDSPLAQHSEECGPTELL